MEQKVFLCLDCHVIFYEGENHMCPKVYKLQFLSKLGILNKNSEGIHGSIPHLFQYNSVGQIEGLNYPAAFSSSTYDGIHLQAENLHNSSDGSNSYLKAQQQEHRYSPVMNASKQNKIFDLSLEPSHHVPLRGNEKNSVALDCLVDVQSRTSDTRKETTNYSTVSVVPAQVHEFKNDTSELTITKSMVHNYMITPVLYVQEGLDDSRFSGGTSSGEYCATTDVNNQDFLFSTDSCRPEPLEITNERMNSRLTNILATNCISWNHDFVPGSGDENETSHLLSSPQVISETCDIRGNKLADDHVPLVSESAEKNIAGPSHRNVDDYIKYQDGRFICRLCEKSYSTKPKFIIHYRNHTGERPYACDQCPKAFMNKKHLHAHYKIHFDERPYPCDMCEKRFFTAVDLDNHYQIHSVERNYACDKCTRRFTQKFNLTAHLQSHIGEKPYNCDMCDKRYTSKSNLNRHRQTHI